MDNLTENIIQYDMDTDKEYCRTLFDILLCKGVKDIVLSPGSRNAPLLIATACRPFNRHTVTDERTAAFMALGISLAGKKPVALVCTSGTALYNYAPAVAEAFYQHVPLIVITADRPLEWIDQDDSQTLVQPGALDKIVKGTYDIPVEHPDSPHEAWYVNRIVNEACNLALSGRKGPVHINVRLDNPLTDVIPFVSGMPRIIEYTDNLNLPPHLYKETATFLQGKKVLVTAGFMQADNELNRYMSAFARMGNVAVMCETLSNLHLPGNPYAIDSVLSIIENNADVCESLRPDVVISIGGALISRKLKEYIRKYPPAHHWTLGDTSPSADCFMTLTRHFEVSPVKFFKGLTRHMAKMPENKTAADYSMKWETERAKAIESHENYVMQKSGWSEMAAFRHMLEKLPPSYNLFLSNGTAVRYGQLFTDSIPHASFGCRGVSGIDGTTATAAGCAMAYNGPTLLISGDMSMAYDTGVLGMRHLPVDFKIAVINNKGGGIFRFIPSTRNCTGRDELFCASPYLPVKGLAESYGWAYFKAESMMELEECFTRFLEHKHNALLEIIADENISAEILIEYMNRK